MVNKNLLEEMIQLLGDIKTYVIKHVIKTGKFSLPQDLRKRLQKILIEITNDKQSYN